MSIRDPSYAVQAAVMSALTTSADMITAFGGTPRVYDTVPASAAGVVSTGLFPYCVIGDDQVIPGELNSNTDISEIYVKIETWSRPTGPVNNGEMKLIAGAVRAALDQAIPVQGHDIVTHAFHGHRFMRQPDGLTRLAVTTILYRTTPVGVSPVNP